MTSQWSGWCTFSRSSTRFTCCSPPPRPCAPLRSSGSSRCWFSTDAGLRHLLEFVLRRARFVYLLPLAACGRKHSHLPYRRSVRRASFALGAMGVPLDIREASELSGRTLAALFAFRLRSWGTSLAARRAAIAGAALIAVAIVSNVATLPNVHEWSTIYDQVFLSILPESKTPASDAKALGLTVEWVKYSGTGAWTPGTNLEQGGEDRSDRKTGHQSERPQILPAPSHAHLAACQTHAAGGVFAASGMVRQLRTLLRIAGSREKPGVQRVERIHDHVLTPSRQAHPDRADALPVRVHRSMVPMRRGQAGAFSNSSDCSAFAA